MPARYTYPVDLSTDAAGRVVARVPDLVGCVTDGADEAEALEEAADALEEALAAAIRAGEDIPKPSPAAGRPTVSPHAVTATKCALYMAMREEGVSRATLRDRLDVDEKEVRRMLDPAHKTKIERLEAGLRACGRRLVISVEAA
ncbi:type II toxin-antitoxin system HicB family antitoxin [Novispirillum sp. DQ9]|uniref:type II toxin-antitoxin system HicB family antitoxin n=1 Tax=Novispirillum sp. DQ9 TaxID=3398612 RepID=UPI003C7EC434